MAIYIQTGISMIIPFVSIDSEIREASGALALIVLGVSLIHVW